jgi:hypothetical protein
MTEQMPGELICEYTLQSTGATASQTARGQGRGQLLHPGQRDRGRTARPLVGTRRESARVRSKPDRRAQAV